MNIDISNYRFVLSFYMVVTRVYYIWTLNFVYFYYRRIHYM
jgi:hypothetical protein